MFSVAVVDANIKGYSREQILETIENILVYFIQINADIYAIEHDKKSILKNNQSVFQIFIVAEFHELLTFGALVQR